MEEHLEQPGEKNTLGEDLANLDKLEHKLTAMTIPAGYMPDLYDLRLHLDLLRDRVKRKTG